MDAAVLGPGQGRRDGVDWSLYLVTDTRLCGALGVAETVRRAVAAGVTVVQLRDPDADDDTFVRIGHEVANVLLGSGIPLLVNDRVHLAGRIGADGAHVGQGDLDVAQARQLLDEQVGPGALLGLSVQTHDHVRTAVDRFAGDVVLDYLGVGPVFAQTTKPDAAEPGGPELLRDLVAVSPWPCVGIGGIDATNAGTVRRAGAAGVAVVSAICGRPDVAGATRALRAAWDGGAPGQPAAAGPDDGPRSR